MEYNAKLITSHLKLEVSSDLWDLPVSVFHGYFCQEEYRKIY